MTRTLTLPVIAFVNAGDPDLDTTERLLGRLDGDGVFGVELCVPYVNPFTDGEPIRRSHERALAAGTRFADVVALLRRVLPRLSVRVYLMADWSHTVRPLGLEAFLDQVAALPLAGLLVHGLPPVMQERLHEGAARRDIAPVRTAYLPASDEVLKHRISGPAGFVYLVSQYGAAGGQAGFTDEKLRAIREARRITDRPLFVGFGIRSPEDVAAVRAAGADGVVVGGAFVAALETHLHHTDVLLDEASAFVNRLCPHTRREDCCAP